MTSHRMLAVLTASITMASTSIAQEARGRVVNIPGITADSFRAVRVRQLIKVWTADGAMIEGRFASADSGKGALFFQKRPEPILFTNVDVLYTGEQYPVPFAALGAVVVGSVVPTMVAILCWGTCGGFTPVNVLIAGSLGGFAGAKLGLSMKNWKLRYSRR